MGQWQFYELQKLVKMPKQNIAIINREPEIIPAASDISLNYDR